MLARQPRPPMSWNAFVDLYCERTDAAFTAEPLNAMSNLAFFVAAYALYRALRMQGIAPRRAPDLHALPALIALIGLGSLAFHVFARRWAGVLDVAFIALYLHAYVAIYCARALGMRWRIAWIGAPAFFLFAQAVDAASGAALTDPVVRGTAGYLPALFALALLAAWLRLRDRVTDDRRAARALATAAALFVVSLAFRQIDLPMCARWPVGTHFVWHVLNGVVLWQTARVFVMCRFV